MYYFLSQGGVEFVDRIFDRQTLYRQARSVRDNTKLLYCQYALILDTGAIRTYAI